MTAILIFAIKLIITLLAIPSALAIIELYKAKNLGAKVRDYANRH